MTSEMESVRETPHGTRDQQHKEKKQMREKHVRKSDEQDRETSIDEGSKERQARDRVLSSGGAEILLAGPSLFVAKFPKRF